MAKVKAMITVNVMVTFKVMVTIKVMVIVKVKVKTITWEFPENLYSSSFKIPPSSLKGFEKCLENLGLQQSNMT